MGPVSGLFDYSYSFIFGGYHKASYRYREMIVSHAPKRLKDAFPRRNHYVPVSTFSQQANAGLTSSAFDIEANVRDGDSRTGLDDQGTQEVLDIMRRERVK